MKLRLIVIGMAVAGTILLTLFYPESPDEKTEVIAQQMTEPIPPAPKNIDQIHLKSADPTGVRRSTTVSQNSTEEQLHHLEKLGTRQDAEAFNQILRELQNPVLEVRMAALEAIQQVGHREAIPILKELAGKTEDVREKVAFLEAADFLALPSFTEIHQQTRAKTGATNR